jgi:protein TonB
MAYATTFYKPSPPSGRAAAAGVVIALHLLALYAVMQLEPVRSAITAAAPIMVSLIEPARPKVEPPKPVPPKPRVQQPQPTRPVPAPVIAAVPTAPAVQSAPPPVPAPAPIEQAPIAAPAPPPPVAVAPAPAPLMPPRFNADYLNNPAPAYPPIARRMGEEGKVMLRVHVNERGLPDDVKVQSSSGSDRLDTTAQETVRHWKFVPARRGDTPVEAWVLVPISFSLRS